MKQISITLISLCIIGCFGAEPQTTGKEGKLLPEFTLLLKDSITRLHTSNIPSGKPTVLFFFSPYCKYCKSLTNKIIENMDNLNEIQFYFISNFPLDALKKYDLEYQLGKYPNITIAQESSDSLSDYFEISGYPYLAIYGKDKKLNKTFLGKIYTSQLKKIAEE